MTDGRPITGEQQPVQVLQNGGPSWRWLVTLLLGTVIPLGAGIAVSWSSLTNDITRLQVEVEAVKDQISLERGMTERHDVEIRQNRESIIKHEARPHRRR